MDVLFPRCAGLDVHKDTVVACVRVASGGQASQEVRTFETTTTALLSLSDWLAERECTHVAMEATGVYWKPVWHVLAGNGFELVLANASHIRNVPGRKTDVNDAMWIADLLAHGLVRASFVPEVPIQELRGLTRTRKQLVREKAQHVQRIQKTLEDANLKFGSFVSDIVGASGQAVLDALIAGESNPEKLFRRTQNRLKAPRAVLVEALRGCVTRHHRFLLKLHLDQVRFLNQAISLVEAEIGAAIEPYRVAATRLVSIPGVSHIVAQVLLAEIGIDMTRFPSDAHIISWAGLCPRNDESAGKRRSTRLRKGAPWLKTTLVQAAWAAIRKKDTYLRAQFLRIKSRRGPKKAIIAVAASILRAAYFMLSRGVEYRDLGPDYFDRTDAAARIRRLTRKLEELGYEVALKKCA